MFPKYQLNVYRPFTEFGLSLVAMVSSRASFIELSSLSNKQHIIVAKTSLLELSFTVFSVFVLCVCVCYVDFTGQRTSFPVYSQVTIRGMRENFQCLLENASRISRQGVGSKRQPK